ncbi:uncharacterized protein LOC142239557 isoform X2 [Haematobia irritans]|uniref:uncharacterized protein LOC142233292 isoform X2 n=1 Tax=Haematobia irritans TaxID=7368 RepID=UPI003F4FBD30
MVGLQMFHKYMNWRIFFHGFATVGEIVNQIGNPYNNIGLIATLYIRSFVFWGKYLLPRMYENDPSIRFVFFSVDRAEFRCHSDSHKYVEGGVLLYLEHLPEKCCGHKLNNHQHIVLPVNQHECVGNHSGRY